MKPRTAIKPSNPLDVLVDSMGGSPSRAIEKSEKEGQDQLVNSSQLPVIGMDGDHFSGNQEGKVVTIRQLLENYGGKVLRKTPSDPLFYDVLLPKGWSIVPTDHSMWSNLVDEKKRPRAGIFYKAAFYDRSAHMGIKRRFSAGYGCENWQEKPPRRFFACIKDSGETILWKGPVEPEEHDLSAEYRRNPNYQTVTDRMVKQAAELLRRTYPDHANPLAYWDLEPQFPTL